MTAHPHVPTEAPAHPAAAGKWLVGLGFYVQDDLVWHYYLIDRAAGAAAAADQALRRARLETDRLPRGGTEPVAYEVRHLHQDLFGQWVLSRPRSDGAHLASHKETLFA
ncbi:hypothetical protein ACIO8H_35490 [Streptomyces sp. NPDC087226]|uniref:hypothetical protein n=1 Tax=Streptomyces sp. NPDC087226 TaxID=3365771 RepID=UPI003815CF5A